MTRGRGDRGKSRNGGRPQTPQLDDPAGTVDVECWCRARIVTIGVAQFKTDHTGTCGQKWCRPPDRPETPGPGLARTAMAPGPGPKRIGAGTRRRKKTIAAAYALVDRRSAGICEARVSLAICALTAVDHHHVGKRSVWPELRAEVDNIRHVCRPCHDWIDANQDQAELLGLHVPRNTDTGREWAQRFGIHP